MSPKMHPVKFLSAKGDRLPDFRPVYRVSATGGYGNQKNQPRRHKGTKKEM